jgi:hypothetical protein
MSDGTIEKARADQGVQRRCQSKLPQRLLALRTACNFPLPREEWQKNMFSIAIVALVAIAVVVGFFFVMRPEQNQ